MKKIKKIIFFSSLISALGVFSVAYPIFAGGVCSKSSSQRSASIRIVSDPRYFPEYASDGGLSYFYSWHIIRSESFKEFCKKYEKTIENEKSATLLSDSKKDYHWETSTPYDNELEIEKPEGRNNGPKKYFIRLDYKNKIIYTIRKHETEYLCTFYLTCFHPDSENPVVFPRYYMNLKTIQKTDPKTNLLLPIDKELLSN